MILPFKIQQQVLSQWCWAALTSSISLYYDRRSSWRQDRIVATILNNSTCYPITPSNASGAPPSCNTQGDLQASLQLTNNFAWEVNRPLKLSEIITQINGQWPFCCQILWPGSERSHFVAVYGYNGSNLIVGDPDGGVFPISYDQLMTNYRGSGKWVRSYATTP